MYRRLVLGAFMKYVSRRLNYCPCPPNSNLRNTVAFRTQIQTRRSDPLLYRSADSCLKVLRFRNMEALYSKLYNKYTKLKKEKESKLEQLNRDQEVKFVNYAAAADEMILYLKSENDRLRGQVDELKSELAFIRSSKDEQEVQHQKLLMEENQKNKELSEEIVKLKKLEQEGTCHSRQEKFESRQSNTHTSSPDEGVGSGLSAMKSKKRKSLPAIEGTAVPHIDMEHDNAADKCSDRNEVGGALNIQQPACCQRKADTSETVNCMFQVLIEFVVGMKLSFVTQKDELCISALHQSSGYSFRLTWTNNSCGEGELVYHLSSLGTFERVAPEWMRETMMFSTSMCPVFFERKTPMSPQKWELWFSNEDIQIDILSRLSAMILNRMKCVSKEWKYLISDRSFIRFQVKNTETVKGFFFQESQWSDNNIGFINYIPVEGEGEKVWRTVLNFLPEKVVILSSINGLLCCRSCFSSLDPRIYVCNPLNKQWITLQWPHLFKSSSSLALAFDPLQNPIDASTDFKLVLVSDTMTSGGDYHLSFDIYSTETGKWRRSNEFCQCKHKLTKNKGIFVEGRLYWLTDGYQILMFHPQVELSWLIMAPLPATYFRNIPEMCIGESEGRLCYVIISEDGLQLWVLEDYFASQWALNTCITLKELEKENSSVLSNMSKKMASSINRGTLPRWIDPLAFKDGMLFVRVATSIYLFQFETKKMKKLTEISMLGLNPMDSPTVIPYTMSLVPLG
ncbi:unnamed protein product [Fraxinus pennsylvanica]|uniref:F-box protein n=1 Tax=Fraxinus pennsylvanica TaxID=56036 RepID=A0AAD2DHF5_9LAMI|nr:unnamed protein product [Fraxinus pennsylvanica]